MISTTSTLCSTTTATSPIVRFKLVNKKRKRGSDVVDVTSMSSSVGPSLTRHSRQRSLANLTFTSLRDGEQSQPGASSNPPPQLRRPSHGSASSLSSAVTATSSPLTSTTTQAPTTARTHTRSTSTSLSDVRALTHATIIGPDVTATNNGKRRRQPSASSVSAPASPRHEEAGEGWYFTPSVTPVVVPTPTSSPRTRKRSTGARSVPNSPKRSPSPPLHHPYPPRPQLARASASTSAMPTYPRTGPAYPHSTSYGAMVDSLGLHSRHTYQEVGQSDSEDDEDAMWFGGRFGRSSRNQPFPRRSSAEFRAPVADTETDGEFVSCHSCHSKIDRTTLTDSYDIDSPASHLPHHLSPSHPYRIQTYRSSLALCHRPFLRRPLPLLSPHQTSTCPHSRRTSHLQS